MAAVSDENNLVAKRCESNHLRVYFGYEGTRCIDRVQAFIRCFASNVGRHAVCREDQCCTVGDASEVLNENDSAVLEAFNNLAIMN